MIARRPVLLALAPLAVALGACGGGESRGTVSAFPAPGATAAAPQTQVSLRGVRDVGEVRVTGSRSGDHDGELREHGDGRGVSFVPDEPFEPGERVTVRVAEADVRGARADAYEFAVARRPARSGFGAASEEDLTRGSGSVQEFRSRPDLAPPAVTVTHRSEGSTPGHVVLGPKGGQGQDGPMVLDEHGRLVYFHPLRGTDQAADVRVQRLEGRQVLTWWEGRIGFGQGRGEGVVLDEAYRELACVRAGNGYVADLHEFALTSRGTALLTIYAPVPRDLRAVGGAREGIAIEGVVQEVDLKTGLVLFEWHSPDHVGIEESQYEVPREANRPWDYFHINSVSEDRDGDLLVSARHTFAVYKLDRESGAVRWRLGGERSDFRMQEGSRFAWQHDARRARDGTLTLFDNHHTRSAPKPSQELTDGPGRERSRALALRLDERAGVASVAREAEHPRELLSDTQASTELLPNGNLFVGWGSQRWFSEFSADGALVFDGHLAEGSESYRAYRAAWRGRPETRPALAVRDRDVFVSWNGATEVARWELLMGSAEGSLRAVPGSGVARSGFETRLVAPADPAAGAVVAARGLDASGRELGRSAAVPLSAR